MMKFLTALVATVFVTVSFSARADETIELKRGYILKSSAPLESAFRVCMLTGDPSLGVKSLVSSFASQMSHSGTLKLTDDYFHINVIMFNDLGKQGDSSGRQVVAIPDFRVPAILTDGSTKAKLPVSIKGNGMEADNSQVLFFEAEGKNKATLTWKLPAVHAKMSCNGTNCTLSDVRIVSSDKDGFKKTEGEGKMKFDRKSYQNCLKKMLTGPKVPWVKK